MLNIIIDGASFNAPKYVGENLVTTGGMETLNNTVGGEYLLGAHLNGGVESDYGLFGDYDFGYNGGMASGSTVWSEYWTLPAILNEMGFKMSFDILST